MDDDELITIGQFARRSGLSVHALRHYDDVGLLPPASVDPETGYRRYRTGQIGTARLIRALRWTDLPVEEIRAVLDADGNGHDVLARHRRRLERQRDLLTTRLGEVDRILAEGITMPAPQTGCRPVQLKITVDDLTKSIDFYRDAFGFRYDVARRTEDEDYPAFLFGTYGEDDHFLLHLLADTDDIDRLGPSTFGLLVDDLDARHAAALTAGGTEVCAAHEPEGMPRCSAVKDPSGNWIWLYQG
jgi:DNA-binding transcriptional MerR regulator